MGLLARTWQCGSLAHQRRLNGSTRLASPAQRRAPRVGGNFVQTGSPGASISASFRCSRSKQRRKFVSGRGLRVCGRGGQQRDRCEPGQHHRFRDAVRGSHDPEFIEGTLRGQPELSPWSIRQVDGVLRPFRYSAHTVVFAYPSGHALACPKPHRPAKSTVISSVSPIYRTDC